MRAFPGGAWEREGSTTHDERISHLLDEMDAAVTSPTPKPTLREQLDAVRPDSDDLLDVELQDAALAIEESDEWREVFERQQAFDREVAATMQGVDVPEGLKDRLLESLAAARESDVIELSVEKREDSTVSAGDHQPSTINPQPLSRRRALRTLATAAGLLLTATLGWLIWPHGGSQITLAEARHELPTAADGTIDVRALPAFDEGFAVSLPNSSWLRRTVQVADIKGLDWTGDGRHDAAVYEFQAGRVHGYLLILPSSRLVDPPKISLLSTTDVDYQPAMNTAWTDAEQGLTYICYVDAGGDLETLQRLLSPHTA